jgi:hypothetical protein
MTDFLTIAGLVIPVAEGSFKENEPTRGGSESFSYNGTLRNTTRWLKRSWSLTTGLMLKIDGEALKTAVETPPGAPVVIGGTASIPSPCRVRVGEGSVVTAESEDSNDWLIQYAITIREP